MATTELSRDLVAWYLPPAREYLGQHVLCIVADGERQIVGSLAGLGTGKITYAD
jgi:hypothetical protein